MGNLYLLPSKQGWEDGFIFNDSVRDRSCMGSSDNLTFWLKISMPGSADETFKRTDNACGIIFVSQKF